jgi:hypothetical protein
MAPIGGIGAHAAVIAAFVKARGRHIHQELAGGVDGMNLNGAVKDQFTGSSVSCGRIGWERSHGIDAKQPNPRHFVC